VSRRAVSLAGGPMADLADADTRAVPAPAGSASPHPRRLRQSAQKNACRNFNDQHWRCSDCLEARR
jgi:hypothetical protein